MASSLARKLARTDVTLECGNVVGTGAVFEVRLADGVVSARRAKSCVVAPALGDRVLCAVEAGEAFVLAVLEGEPDVRIAVDGQLEVEARGGRLALRSSERVDIVSAGAVAVASSEITLSAKRSTVAVDELGFVGRLVQAKATKVALFAEELDSMVTRVTQRAKRVFRFVEQLDQTRAGAVDLRAAGLFGIRGENALIAARQVAKVDGEQIHIG
jgi:hypothetical protein